jgi:uncharacterized membrane protein
MKPTRTLSDITRKNVEMVARIEAATNDKRTVGQRVADRFASGIGNWGFIIAQCTVFISWIILNVVAWSRHWDPYPFILLDVLLTFQAALAGPVLMMSQNRQARLNEQRNHLDLQINLLAEQENTEILVLLHRICEKLGLEIDGASPAKPMTNATDANALIEQIQQAHFTEPPDRTKT